MKTKLNYCFLFLLLGADPGYVPQPTSYDYDAPISEPGLLINSYRKLLIG
jgi:hypothetical protein